MENEESKEITDGLTEIKQGLLQLTVMHYQYLLTMADESVAYHETLHLLDTLKAGIESTRTEKNTENND